MPRPQEGLLTSILHCRVIAEGKGVEFIVTVVLSTHDLPSCARHSGKPFRHQLSVLLWNDLRHVFCGIKAYATCEKATTSDLKSGPKDFSRWVTASDSGLHACIDARSKFRLEAMKHKSKCTFYWALTKAASLCATAAFDS